MSDFKPGDEVVCVIAHDMPYLTPGAGCPVVGLTEGAVYTVSYLGPCDLDGETDFVVRLKETANLDGFGRDWGYLPIRFRKVQRRDLSVWLATKNTIEDPKRVPAPEDA